MKYILRRMEFYILSVVIMMIIYGIITVGFFVRLSIAVQNVAIAVILFEYPLYRIVRSTVKVAVDYYDAKLDLETEYKGSSQNSKIGNKSLITELDYKGNGNNSDVFSRLYQKLLPKFLANNRKRVFRLNMLSKFIQLCVLGTVIYAFAANDYQILVVSALIIIAVCLSILVLLIKMSASEYIETRQQETDELSRAQAAAGFAIDHARRRLFLRRPLFLLIANVILLAVGMLMILVNSQLDNSVILSGVDVVDEAVIADSSLLRAGILYLCSFIRIMGITSMVLLPFNLVWGAFEVQRSYSYTLETGQGEYGQIKIEFYRYEGSGDNRKSVRNKIDRVESFHVKRRYIVVRKAAQVRVVKIPRTFAGEDRILEILKIMSA